MNMQLTIKNTILNNPIQFILGLYVFLRIISLIGPLLLPLIILLVVVQAKHDFILLQLIRNSYRELDQRIN